LGESSGSLKIREYFAFEKRIRCPHKYNLLVNNFDGEVTIFKNKSQIIVEFLYLIEAKGKIIVFAVFDLG
jgi:hypothetical protein